MSFISSTNNLINALKKLPTLAQSYYASGLQIHIKDITGEDILSFEIQGEDFASVAESLVTAISKRLVMRKVLLENEVNAINELNIQASGDIPLLEQLLEVLYDQPHEYSEVLTYLNLTVQCAEEFTSQNDYDYREYLNDVIRDRLEDRPEDAKYLYLKVGLVL